LRVSRNVRSASQRLAQVARVYRCHNQNVSTCKAVLFLAIAAVLTFGHVGTASAGPSKSAGGKYRDLIKSFDCERDRAKYGSYQDHGYYRAIRWCGHDVPAGYWVWVAPRWYVWKRTTKTAAGSKLTPLQRATVGGKYKKLLMTLHVPADVAQYGKFHDHSYYAATRYAGKSVPAGHWVYVAPTWYVFKTKDLAAAGLTVMKRNVKFMKRTITFRFEYKRKHHRWANAQLNALIRGVHEVERWSGVPFPGSNPYRIYEGIGGGLLGFAGPKSMYLAPPPRTSTWTLMHEMLHIWNAGARPMWIGEGQANFVSFWLMRRLKMPFTKGNTLYSWIATWKKYQGKAKDVPLYDGKDNYRKQPQGKAMELWSILYQYYGPSFLRWVFIQTTKKKHIGLSSIVAYLRSAKNDKNAGRLFTGWVTRGRYHHKSHKLRRPKYRLP